MGTETRPHGDTPKDKAGASERIRKVSLGLGLVNETLSKETAQQTDRLMKIVPGPHVVEIQELVSHAGSTQRISRDKAWTDALAANDAIPPDAAEKVIDGMVDTKMLSGISDVFETTPTTPQDVKAQMEALSKLAEDNPREKLAMSRQEELVVYRAAETQFEDVIHQAVEADIPQEFIRAIVQHTGALRQAADRIELIDLAYTVLSPNDALALWQRKRDGDESLREVSLEGEPVAPADEFQPPKTPISDGIAVMEISNQLVADSEVAKERIDTANSQVEELNLPTETTAAIENMVEASKENERLVMVGILLNAIATSDDPALSDMATIRTLLETYIDNVNHVFGSSEDTEGDQ